MFSSSSNSFQPLQMWIWTWSFFLIGLHCLSTELNILIRLHVYGRPIGQAIIFCSCDFFFFLVPHVLTNSQYGELPPTNGWDRLASLGHPSKFQAVSRLGLVTAPTSLNGGQPNFAQCLAVSWAGTLYTHSRGSCPLTEFCQSCSGINCSTRTMPQNCQTRHS